MKFAKHLEAAALPKFRSHYIRYKALKKLLKALETYHPDGSDTASSDADEADRRRSRVQEVSRRFLAELQSEVAKINAFVLTRQERLMSERDAIEELRRLVNSSSPELRAQLVAQERDMWRNSADLRAFVELNYTGVYKAAKKHDKLTKLHYLDAVMHAVDLQPFMALLEPNRSTLLAEGGGGGLAAGSLEDGGGLSDRTPLLLSSVGAEGDSGLPSHPATSPQAGRDRTASGGGGGGVPAALREHSSPADVADHAHQQHSAVVAGTITHAAHPGDLFSSARVGGPLLARHLRGSAPDSLNTPFLGPSSFSDDLDLPLASGPLPMSRHDTLAYTTLPGAGAPLHHALSDGMLLSAGARHHGAGGGVGADAWGGSPLAPGSALHHHSSSTAALPSARRPSQQQHRSVTILDSREPHAPSVAEEVLLSPVEPRGGGTSAHAGAAGGSVAADVAATARKLDDESLVSAPDATRAIASSAGAPAADRGPALVLVHSADHAPTAAVVADAGGAEERVAFEGATPFATALSPKAPVAPSPTALTVPPTADGGARIGANGAVQLSTQRAAPGRPHPLLPAPVATAVSPHAPSRGRATAAVAGSASSLSGGGALLLHWNLFDGPAAATMLSQFDLSLRQSHDFTSAALKVVSPELTESRTERLKRLARFTLALLQLRKRVARHVAAGRPLREIHDSILAAKLELYRFMLKVVMREVELTFPEGAAALEHLGQAFYLLFGMYMSERVRVPSRRRIDLMRRLHESAGSFRGGGTDALVSLGPSPAYSSAAAAGAGASPSPAFHGAAAAASGVRMGASRPSALSAAAAAAALAHHHPRAAAAAAGGGGASAVAGGATAAHFTAGRREGAHLPANATGSGGGRGVAPIAVPHGPTPHRGGPLGFFLSLLGKRGVGGGRGDSGSPLQPSTPTTGTAAALELARTAAEAIGRVGTVQAIDAAEADALRAAQQDQQDAFHFAMHGTGGGGGAAGREATAAASHRNLLSATKSRAAMVVASGAATAAGGEMAAGAGTAAGAATAAGLKDDTGNPPAPSPAAASARGTGTVLGVESASAAPRPPPASSPSSARAPGRSPHHGQGTRAVSPGRRATSASSALSPSGAGASKRPLPHLSLTLGPSSIHVMEPLPETPVPRSTSPAPFPAHYFSAAASAPMPRPSALPPPLDTSSFGARRPSPLVPDLTDVPDPQGGAPSPHVGLSIDAASPLTPAAVEGAVSGPETAALQQAWHQNQSRDYHPMLPHRHGPPAPGVLRTPSGAHLIPLQPKAVLDRYRSASPLTPLPGSPALPVHATADPYSRPPERGRGRHHDTTARAAGAQLGSPPNGLHRPMRRSTSLGRLEDHRQRDRDNEGRGTGQAVADAVAAAAAAEAAAPLYAAAAGRDTDSLSRGPLVPQHHGGPGAAGEGASETSSDEGIRRLGDAVAAATTSAPVLGTAGQGLHPGASGSGGEQQEEEEEEEEYQVAIEDFDDDHDEGDDGEGGGGATGSGGPGAGGRGRSYSGGSDAGGVRHLDSSALGLAFRGDSSLDRSESRVTSAPRGGERRGGAGERGRAQQQAAPFSSSYRRPRLDSRATSVAQQLHDEVRALAGPMPRPRTQSSAVGGVGGSSVGGGSSSPRSRVTGATSQYTSSRQQGGRGEEGERWQRGQWREGGPGSAARGPRSSSQPRAVVPSAVGGIGGARGGRLPAPLQRLMHTFRLLRTGSAVSLLKSAAAASGEHGAAGGTAAAARAQIASQTSVELPSLLSPPAVGGAGVGALSSDQKQAPPAAAGVLLLGAGTAAALSAELAVAGVGGTGPVHVSAGVRLLQPLPVAAPGYGAKEGMHTATAAIAPWAAGEVGVAGGRQLPEDGSGSHDHNAPGWPPHSPPHSTAPPHRTPCAPTWACCCCSRRGAGRKPDAPFSHGTGRGGCAPWLLYLAGLLEEDPLSEAGAQHAEELQREPGAQLLWQLWVRWRPAIADWAPEYKRKMLVGDITAGVTIGILLLPQGLAYATLAGLPPVYGLYTAFPAALYTIFGTSRQAAIGPMSIPALLIGSGIASMSPPPATPQEYIDAVMSLTFLCGVLLLLLGWLNLAFIIRFISRPVLSGFASASAIITICSSVKDLFGTGIPRSQVIYTYLHDIGVAVPYIHWQTFLTGLAAIALLVLLPKVRALKRVPAPLIVMGLFLLVFGGWMHATGADTAAWAAAAAPGSDGNFYSPGGVKLIGAVPDSFPTFRFPRLSADSLPSLLATAVSVTFVGFIESISVAKQYAAKRGYEISAASELKALGVVNIVGSSLGSFYTAGAFGRSSVNDECGSRSPLSQAISALTVALLLLFVTPALAFLPSSVLSAIIIVAVSGLIDVAGALRLWRLDKRDCATFLAAFAATLLLGVLLGVVTAMAFSLVLFVAITTQPAVEELGRLEGTVIYRHVGMVGVSRVSEVKIIKFLSPLFFANCSVLKDRCMLELSRRRQLPPRLTWRALVLCFASVSSIDSTSLQMLEEVMTECHALGVPLLLASPNAIVEDFLLRTGFTDKLGGRRFMFRRVHEAVRAVLLREVRLPPPKILSSGASSGGAGSVPAAKKGGGGAMAAEHQRTGRSAHRRSAAKRPVRGSSATAASGSSPADGSDDDDDDRDDDRRRGSATHSGEWWGHDDGEDRDGDPEVGGGAAGDSHAATAEAEGGGSGSGSGKNSLGHLLGSTLRSRWRRLRRWLVRRSPKQPAGTAAGFGDGGQGVAISASISAAGPPPAGPIVSPGDVVLDVRGREWDGAVAGAHSDAATAAAAARPPGASLHLRLPTGAAVATAVTPAAAPVLELQRRQLERPGGFGPHPHASSLGQRMVEQRLAKGNRQQQ